MQTIAIVRKTYRDGAGDRLHIGLLHQDLDDQLAKPLEIILREVLALLDSLFPLV